MTEYNKYRFKSKEKPKQEKRRQLLCGVQKKNKQTNKKYIYIIGVALENKIGRQKSTCADYDSKKSTFLKQVTKHGYLL